MREVSSSIRVSRDSGTAARSVVTRRQCLAPSAGSLRATRRPACSCQRAASRCSPASSKWWARSAACVGAAGPWIASKARAMAAWVSGAGDPEAACGRRPPARGDAGRRAHPETRRDREARRSKGARATRRARARADRPRRAATRRHVSPDHGRGLEHVLVALREPIDARREDGLNGLGQRDLLDRGGQPVGAAFATQHATLDERANHLLDEEWVAASPGLDPGAQRREHVVGSEPVVEQRPGVLEQQGGQARAARPVRTTRADTRAAWSRGAGSCCRPTPGPGDAR